MRSELTAGNFIECKNGDGLFSGSRERQIQILMVLFKLREFFLIRCNAPDGLNPRLRGHHLFSWSVWD